MNFSEGDTGYDDSGIYVDQEETICDQENGNWICRMIVIVWDVYWICAALTSNASSTVKRTCMLCYTIVYTDT